VPHFIPANGFAQQVAEFVKQLEFLTDDGVDADDDEGTSTRRTSYLVVIPDAHTGTATTFDYREEFRKITGGWLRSRYTYELRVTQPRGTALHSRRAHHEHDPWGVHQHCQSPSSWDDAHYADVERLLQATHELFVRQFASSSAIDCSGLVPLSAP